MLFISSPRPSPHTEFPRSKTTPLPVHDPDFIDEFGCRRSSSQFRGFQRSDIVMMKVKETQTETNPQEDWGTRMDGGPLASPTPLSYPKTSLRCIVFLTLLAGCALAAAIVYLALTRGEVCPSKAVVLQSNSPASSPPINPVFSSDTVAPSSTSQPLHVSTSALETSALLVTASSSSSTSTSLPNPTTTPIPPSFCNQTELFVRLMHQYADQALFSYPNRLFHTFLDDIKLAISVRHVTENATLNRHQAPPFFSQLSGIYQYSRTLYPLSPEANRLIIEGTFIQHLEGEDSTSYYQDLTLDCYPDFIDLWGTIIETEHGPQHNREEFYYPNVTLFFDNTFPTLTLDPFFEGRVAFVHHSTNFIAGLEGNCTVDYEAVRTDLDL